MNIGGICEFADGGGASIEARNQVRHLSDRGHFRRGSAKSPSI
jgi:hypothetical protein